MDLFFTKSETGKSWVAEFEATADFNLHIERDKGGNLMLYQRTNGGGWDIVNDFANPRFGAIDYDCAALIYPKFIKVVSEVEPTYAAVTSAGEVTEIKSQAKVVEITSNGTTSVEPDAGYAYLSKVDVKTNVPTEGSGSGDNVKCFAIGMDNIVASDFAPENLQTIFQYEEGMTFADWLVSDYNTTFEPDSGDGYLSFIGGASAILMDNGFTREVRPSEVIQSTVYMLYGDY